MQNHEPRGLVGDALLNVFLLSLFHASVSRGGVCTVTQRPLHRECFARHQVSQSEVRGMKSNPTFTVVSTLPPKGISKGRLAINMKGISSE